MSVGARELARKEHTRARHAERLVCALERLENGEMTR